MTTGDRLDETGINPSSEPRFQDVLARRSLLRGLLAATALATAALPRPTRAEDGSTLGFNPIPHGPQPDHAVAEGYDARVLIRWGDPILPGAPAFDPRNQTAAAQAGQFGYNGDFQAFLPLPRTAPNPDRGLLWVNHEYIEAHMAFPGTPEKGAAQRISAEQVNVELQALGGSIVELARDPAGWKTVIGPLNRRITASTPMRVAGPAAGHPRMQTSADPSGTRILGMFGNCAGGTTPWGTVLTCEENFDQYFSGSTAGSPEAEGYRRIGLTGEARSGWGRFHDRFNVEREPNEPNRFGWVVEIDPYDPAAMPVKRTALGRFKHEGATTALTPDGRLAIYSGDDQRFEYLYRFVTRDPVDLADRAANRDLLDHGTLSVARFGDDGVVTWMPLVFGEGALTPANGFRSQADVAIDARRAADLAKATPMDRPEDVEPNPVTGKVYVVLTNNSSRKANQTDRANPRAGNLYGQILEMTPPPSAGKPDHAAATYAWDMFLAAGNPSVAAHQARYGGELTASGWLACPDNIAFDAKGRMWIATDQGKEQSKYGIGDGIWACDTEGPGRAITRMFYRVPVGAEMCGPEFTPDNRTFFVAVQHPAADFDGSSADNPVTRWPDFDPAMPPRPATVVITKRDGGTIGT